MSNRVVVTTNKSWLSRLMGSVVGVFIGIGLFLGSFFVLWINEGRTDLSTIADDSVAVSAARVDAANEGKLVAAAGVLETEETLGDGEYLEPGAYLALERHVEMYAWEESSSSQTNTNLGGSETTTTEYTYDKGWTSNPEDSSDFQEPRGHQNPNLTIDEQSLRAESGMVGAFSVDPAALRLPSENSLALDADMLTNNAEGDLSDDYLFIGQGTMQSPRVGDVRISYSFVPSGIDVTLFGRQDGDALVPFTRGDDQLYMAHDGDRASAIEALHGEYQVMGWIFRVIGFVMMWIGLSMLTGPLSTFLDVLPFLGGLSRTMLGFAAFGIALFLTIITVFIAALLQNIVALIVLLVFILAIVGFLYWRGKQSPPAQPKVA